VLNQLPRDSWHVSRLPCEDVPIFLKEFDEREFLFGIQSVAYVSNLGWFLHKQRDLLAECFLRLDGLFGGLGVGHDRARGGLSQGLFELPKFCGCRKHVSHLVALPVTVIGSLDVSLMEMTPCGRDIFKTK
jgi:hypothetical protein